MEKQQSLPSAVEDLWNEWEIHCLILTSLFLQVFLLVTAGMRRRSTSCILCTVLWLAYLSADSVAIFVLGHLAVHVSRPGHQFMSFWAPFVLVHLGGQETITAFSKQDNELWTRHLLSLVYQVVVAVYVVAKVPWPDARLRAAMVIMLLSGCFKYVERIVCLYLGSQGRLKGDALHHWSNRMRRDHDRSDMRTTLGLMSRGSSVGLLIDIHKTDTAFILGADAPINSETAILEAEHLPGLLEEFLSNPDRHRAYEYVGELLVQFYNHLYTKLEIRECFYIRLSEVSDALATQSVGTIFVITSVYTFILLYTVFQYVSALVALVLLMVTQHRGQLTTASKADTNVSYVLLIAAVVQDLLSAIMFVFSNARYNLPPRILCVANCIRSAWSSKLWSEELAQCSIIKRYTVQNTGGMWFLPQWIRLRLTALGIGLLEVTRTPVTEDHTPLKKFILDNLLVSGKREEWNIASSRGQLALQKWMDMHRHQAGPYSGAGTAKALEKSVSRAIDFPTSVLIWHISTDICYYYSGDNSSANSDQTNKDKQISRELSNYLMYLVFKCGVLLTNKSQIAHVTTHDIIATLLLSDDEQIISDEKDAVIKLFQARVGKYQDQVDNDGSALSHLQELKTTTLGALGSVVMSHAVAVARELIGISDAAERWRLIAAVWSEMLYFVAPRCGSAFHCEHLSTGGEFITHVLLLMSSLGPFLPPPSA